ncbi:MAG: DUF3579 domain-containing protein [Betaproteobacteria bacterium]|nr:DUF3579 domain-containing protein [Betaproteobacteria bacterium]
MTDQPKEMVIIGATESGGVFRPSDWAERLCGVIAIFGEDQRINYSPFLQPIFCQGIRSVVIDTQLKEMEPAAFDFLMGFARDNELKIRPGRCEARPEYAPHRAVTSPA